MTLRPFSFLLLPIFFSCCLQATAWAQEPTPETGSQPSLPAPETVKPAETKSGDAQSWPNFEKAFQAGVESYRAKKYDEARLAFGQALEKQPLSVQTLTNLGLTQYQLGQKGWAVALLRKAHNLDPDFSTPKTALDFILPQLDVKEIPHEIQLWETTRANFIVPFSLTGFLGITALSFFATGWLLLSYFGRRRAALREEKSFPPFPLIPSIIALIFIGCVVLTLLKIWDQGIPRGTVVSDKITVYSAPNDKSVALFDLFSGLEIILNTSDNQWVQITYPGALTGWVPKASVFQTSGRSQW